MQIDPKSHDRRAIYRLATSAVVPRPVAWVSTVGPNGLPNLAPFSFFTLASVQPLVVAISIQDRPSSVKDTYANILSGGDFVVNLVSSRLAEAMNLTSGEYPPDQSEFSLSGMTPAASVKVKSPRVAESPVSFECRWLHSISLGSPATHLTLGEVVLIHVADGLVDDPAVPIIPPDRLDPVARMGDPLYARLTNFYSMTRPDAGRWAAWEQESRKKNADS